MVFEIAVKSLVTKIFPFSSLQGEKNEWLGTNNNKGWVLIRFSSKKIYKYHFFLRKRPPFNFQIKPLLGYPVNFQNQALNLLRNHLFILHIVLWYLQLRGNHLKTLHSHGSYIWSFPYSYNYKATVCKKSQKDSVAKKRKIFICSGNEALTLLLVR